MQSINRDYQNLFIRDDVAVAATDAKGEIVSANQAFQVLTGYSLTELQQFSYQDITPEVWTIYENKMIIRHVFTEGYACYQKEYIDASGDLIPIEIEVYLLEADSQGKLGMWAKVSKIQQLSEQFVAIKQDALVS